MNLLSKATLLFIILLSFYDLKGQTDFRPGYVITNNNDTLHGLVDYRGDSRNSKKCDFKERVNSEVKEFIPFGIKGYRFLDGKFFVSKNVKSNGEEVPLFLEFLVNGISDLYYYSDGINLHYYIEKADGQLFELTNEDKKFMRDGSEYNQKDNRYIGLLKYAFADCPQIFPLINKARLEDKSLMEITKKYHDYVCDDQKCIIYEKQLPVIRLTFAPFVSINRSYLRIDNHLIYSGITFDPANYPMIGLLLNTSLPRANEKLSFQISGEFGKSYFHGSGNRSFNSVFNEVHLHTTILKLKSGLKYTYPKGKIRPTFMIGGHFLKILKSDGRRIEEDLWNSVVYTSEFEDVPVDNEFLGFNVDLGVNYHIKSSVVTFINLCYENSNRQLGIFSSQSYSTKINTINLHAGIYF